MLKCLKRSIIKLLYFEYRNLNIWWLAILEVIPFAKMMCILHSFLCFCEQCIYVYISSRVVSLVVQASALKSADRGSNPDRVMQKSLKMLLVAASFSTAQCLCGCSKRNNSDARGRSVHLKPGKTPYHHFLEITSVRYKPPIPWYLHVSLYAWQDVASVYSILSSILHIGNIEFMAQEQQHSGDSCTVTNMSLLDNGKLEFKAVFQCFSLPMLFSLEYAHFFYYA